MEEKYDFRGSERDLESFGTVKVSGNCISSRTATKPKRCFGQIPNTEGAKICDKKMRFFSHSRNCRMPIILHN